MSNKIYLDSKFAFRRDTLANWLSENPVLEAGEPSIVIDATDENWLKIGDGISPWSELPYRLGPKGERGEDGKNTAADHTYSPESLNAQSGKAVAEAIASVKEEWELLHDIVIEEEVNKLTLDVNCKKVYLEAVLKKHEAYESGTVNIYFQTGGYRGAVVSRKYNTSGIMSLQGEMHILPNERICVSLDGAAGEYGYTTSPVQSVLSKTFAGDDGLIDKIELQAPAFGVGSTIKIWGVK